MRRTGGPVLVTGGCGFIGRHLVTGLLAQGYEVVVLDRQCWPDESVASIRLDITEFEGCLAAVGEVDPQLIFHLAASSTIDSAFHDPRGSLADNIGGTMNMLEAARVACGGLRRFVLSSTDKVYGELSGAGYVESLPLLARGTYDVGKLSADNLVRLYGGEFGMPVSILRLCNVFGPGDSNADSRIVPKTLSRLFHEAAPLPPVIYAGSMAHGRDYVYVTDVVRALSMLANDQQAVGEVFNMAPAAHLTTLDLVEKMIDQSQQACEPQDPDRAAAIRKNGYEVVSGAGMPSALERQHCDATKLGSLGFRNTVPMTAGLSLTIDSMLGR